MLDYGQTLKPMHYAIILKEFICVILVVELLPIWDKLHILFLHSALCSAYLFYIKYVYWPNFFFFPFLFEGGGMQWMSNKLFTLKKKSSKQFSWKRGSSYMVYWFIHKVQKKIQISTLLSHFLGPYLFRFEGKPYIWFIF